MLYRSCAFRVDDLDTKEAKWGGQVAEFAGYASTYGNVDRDDDVIEAGAVGRIDNPGAIKMLWQHQQSEPIGVWKQISEDPHGVPVKGQLNLDVQRGREAYALMKQGALSDMSIGFRVPKGQTYTKEIGEGDAKRRVRHIKQVKLFEISVVSIPANPMARITSVKSVSDMPTLREFEALLRDAGADFSRKERAEFAAEYKALLKRCGFFVRDAEEPSDDVARDADEQARKAAEEAEAKRLSDEAKAKADAEAKAAEQLVEAKKAIEALFGETLADLRRLRS